MIAAFLVQACAQAKPQRDAGSLDGSHRDAAASFDSGSPDGAIADAMIRPDGGRQQCVLDSSYVVTADHGLNPRSEVVRLSAVGDVVYEHHDSYGTKLVDSCAATLPPCGDPKLIDGADLLADLSDADVQSALADAQPRFYGQRAADGDALTITRTDGHAMVLDLTSGRNCSPASGSCNPMPQGIKRLLADLEALSAWISSKCAEHNAPTDAGDADGD